MEQNQKIMEQSKRTGERHLIRLQAEITQPKLGKVIVFTRNISDSGAFVILPKDQCPPVGSSLNIRIYRKTEDGNEETFSARVVRVTDSGMGLQFFDFDVT